MHLHCSTLFRHHTGLTADTLETDIELSLVDKLIGQTMSGDNAGRLANFDYETVLGDSEQDRVDIQSLWSAGRGEGRHNFDWIEWQRRGLEWTAVRPDTYVPLSRV